jgi:C-terminal processing protease CtpA/Prc
VRPKSDADAKNVKSGDQILSINGYDVNRDDLWKMQYVFSVLRPQPQMQLELQDPAGNQRTVDVIAKIHEQKLITDLTSPEVWDVVRHSEILQDLLRPRYLELGDQLLALKLPRFDAFQDEVGRMISRAQKHQNLVVDLRGNPGGSIETLKYLVGGMFDKDVKIGDRVGRKEARPEISKGMHSQFTGKLVVLVDSESASAAEIFARVVQLEKRGIVIGDRTSGAVMEAKHYSERMGSGNGTYIFYGTSITEWDLIMTDGRSLEHTGVTPDEIVVPSAQDLANGRDPVLERAAEILGVKISSEEAGKAFPFEWSPE